MEDRLSNSNRFYAATRLSRLTAVMLLIIACGFASNSAMADKPDWIWTPKTSVVSSGTSQGECFFRKKFTLIGPEKAQLVFSAGDEYEIYLNDRLVERGQSFGKSKTVDVSQFIEPGVNLLAAHVKHYDSPVPGLAMKFRVKEKGEARWRSLESDDTWRTRVVETPYWTETSYRDTGWIAAKSITAEQVAALKLAATKKAELAAQSKAAEEKLAAENDANQKKIAAELAANKTTDVSRKFTKSSQAKPAPQKVAATTKKLAPKVAATTKKPAPNKLTLVGKKKDQQAAKSSRFDIDSEFTVSQVLSAKETGSLIAMEFNEFGKLLLSREGGPLMIADPSKPANAPDRIRVYCDEVTSCRGILPLNGSVYVTATSHDGTGLFELNDVKNTGKLSIARQLLSFSGKPNLNGPQGIQLGPEGMLYVVVGKDCEVEQTLAPTSPFKNYHNQNIVPEFDGRKTQSTGGSIVRVSLNGKTVERVAGGIHNAQDIVVDANGEVFLHDSDTRADVGLTWHRPSYAYHVPAGADLGWRSGWSTFPSYFVDQTPAMASTDQALPTGAVQYEHQQFPKRYHGSIFFADWAQGRILSAKPLPDGAGFTTKPTSFLSGRPLNVTDLAVGQSGQLFFCTGGRGTEGGVYSVRWNGETPKELLTFKDDLDRALRQPQPQSAWARQNIAQLRLKMGRNWNDAIQKVAVDKSYTTAQRLRALQLMSMYGPFPSRDLLQTLKADRQPAIRAQIVRMCVRMPEVFKNEIVLASIYDENPYVRRTACEACVRLELEPSFEALVPMLESENRIEALAARRVLERIPSQAWQARVIGSDSKRLFINGSVALLSQHPTLEQGYEVLAKASHLMDGFLIDQDFIDLLRTSQLALTQCDVEPARVSGFTKRIINEFPSASSPINNELARLLGYLQAGDFSGRLETYLADEKISTADRVHVAMHLLNNQDTLLVDERVAILNVLETSRTATPTGSNYDKYLQQAIGKISSTVAGSDIQTVLSNGHRWPETVLTAFYKMPERLDQKTVDAVIAMDRRMFAQDFIDVPTEQVRLGVIAILARDGSDAGMEYLRELWQQEPNRRSDIVIGLSQRPQGENWAYLVGSLTELDDLTSSDVLHKLAKVGQRPKEAKHYQQAIEVGYRLRGDGAHLAADLLHHWSGQTEADDTPDWRIRLATWTAWYESNFPNGEAIATDINQKTIGVYSTAAIVDQIEKSGLGDAVAGKHIFEKANCAACHRVGNQGRSGGPELTDIATRFSLREAVEATVNPSAVVSDRYRSKRILTVDGIVHEGMTMEQTDGSYVLLDQQGKRIRIDANDVQEIGDSSHLAMPEGLLDGLSTTEVSDLMAYLMKQSNSTLANEGQPAQPAARIGAMPTVEKIR